MVFETVMLRDVLHGIAQSMLGPTVVVLVLLVAYSLYQVGSLVAEGLLERRRLRARIPILLKQIDTSPIADLPNVIESSGLLRRQKVALLQLIDGWSLPSGARTALARDLLAVEEARYAQIVGRTDLVARVGPMFGLMGTLIPLAPGLTALAEGNVRILSQSLLLAFDTTIVGLTAAAVCYVISRIRTRWYEQYGVMLETVLTGVLEKAPPSMVYTPARGDEQ